MNLSLVSQKPSATSTQGLLAALRNSTGYGDYFNELTITQPSHWQPGKEEAAILLLDGNAAWPEFAWQRNSDTFGLPVLPLLMRKGDGTLTIQGPDVRDPRFYFVSNGIVLEESELADPACSRVLLNKLESYFPLLSRLILLRQRQPMGLCN
ncbi:hypothetical protein [Aeromonas sp. FDAARGOS 1408]|uniref:hypothetical protein n=1 Tax=Aeromonas TaxID=642 RepID=UPI001C24323B|nr:hypothetical protein [Aeromonas sp. FDAARGOS 1408]QXC09432.1 hypothetical protein I6L38_05630 [Aeromonas sp. FDAARGOS 1408]